MGGRWKVARTLPRMEYLAANELERDGFEIFFPRVQDPRPRIGYTDVPLFPGYLFLRFDPDEVKWPLFTPRHRILGLVRFGEEAAWLPDETIAELVDKLEVINRDNGLWWRFHAGDRVEVTSNGLESLAEVIEDAKSPKARVKVLLEFMGRLVPAQVPLQDLKPAEAHFWEKRGEILWEKQGLHRRTRGRGRWIKSHESRAMPVT